MVSYAATASIICSKCETMLQLKKKQSKNKIIYLKANFDKNIKIIKYLKQISNEYN
jgi:hypothetical protein